MGESGVVIVEYWLASYLGRAWLWLHKDLRPKLGELPGLCALVAHGNSLEAGQLWRAQDFAVRVWWRFGMTAIVLVLPIIGIGAAMRPGRVGTDIGSYIMLGLGALTGVALAQMGLLRYRADRTRFYLARAGWQAGGQPLPPGAAGLPRRADFWLMALIAVAAFAILLFAATRSAQP
ncbi:MAG: hypothetical protein QOJ73_6332 [Streptosporangiaceae bacterium]|jgi:hypothetical protein|nr:hypothetical protein [Streptosporangiaceae bacterium]